MEDLGKVGLIHRMTSAVVVFFDQPRPERTVRPLRLEERHPQTGCRCTPSPEWQEYCHCDRM